MPLPAVQELARGAYLHSIRELKLGCTLGGSCRLPPALTEASCLEQLDLEGCRALRLGPADAALLRALPRLQRLRLPMPRLHSGEQELLERQAECRLVKEALQGQGVIVEGVAL